MSLKPGDSPHWKSEGEFARYITLDYVCRLLYDSLREMAQRATQPGYVGLDEWWTWPRVITDIFTMGVNPKKSKRGRPLSYEIEVDNLRKRICAKLKQLGLVEVISTKERIIFYVPAVGREKLTRRNLSDILSGRLPSTAPAAQMSLSLVKHQAWPIAAKKNGAIKSDSLSDSALEGAFISNTVGSSPGQHNSRHVEKRPLIDAPVENSATVKAMKSRLKNRGAGGTSDRPSASEKPIAGGDRLRLKRLH